MANIDDMLAWAVSTCADPQVRYSQAYRNAGVDSLGYTCYDCSSFVNYALNAGGWDTPSYAPDHNAFTTDSEISELSRLGWVEVNAGGTILPGDIGWRTGHTEICYATGSKDGYGIFMGAHNDYPTTDIDLQVSIGASYGSNPQTWEDTYTRVFRWTGGDPGTPTAKFSFYVAAAMCGNMWAESNCNPGIWESLQPVGYEYNNPGGGQDDKGGYGLIQWTNVQTTHGRAWNLYQWMTAAGYSMDSGDGQCEYIVYEDYWQVHSGYEEITSLQDFLQSNSENLEYLTHYWNRNMEGIGIQDIRVEHAEVLYDYLLEHWTDDVAWIVGNRYLSEAQIKNNAVCVYQWFNDYFGGNSSGGAITGTPSRGESGTDDGSSDAGAAGSPTLAESLTAFTALLGRSGNNQNSLKIKRKRT